MSVNRLESDSWRSGDTPPPDSGRYRSASVTKASEFTDPESVDIAAASSPAMISPESPDGIRSMMNFGKISSAFSTPRSASDAPP